MSMLVSLGKFVKRNLPTILSLAAVGGVIGTAVCAAKAAPKAEKLADEAFDKKELEWCENPVGEEPSDLTKMEYLKAVAPAYGMTAAVAFATIVCILASNHISKAQIAKLSAACAVLAAKRKEIEAAIREKFGDEKLRELKSEIAKKNAAKKMPEFKDDWEGREDLPTKDPDNEKQLYFESYSEQFFWATPIEIERVCTEVNRRLQRYETVKWNDVLEMLNCDKKFPEYEYIGYALYDDSGTWMENWDLANQGAWVDFYVEKDYEIDGTKCNLLHYGPLSPDYLDFENPTPFLSKPKSA